jgi:hypothetical protein
MKTWDFHLMMYTKDYILELYRIRKMHTLIHMYIFEYNVVCSVDNAFGLFRYYDMGIILNRLELSIKHILWVNDLIVNCFWSFSLKRTY